MKKLCCFALGMLATSGPLVAEEEQPLEEITVFATSNPLPVFEYPGQVSLRGREEIELFVPSTVSDLLRDVPGVEFSGGPRRTGETPSIRGRGGENVLVLFDGARQSFISAHDGRFFIEPELLSRAEVVRGSASALYGSGAVGGVLAFETLDARDLLGSEDGGGVRIRAGYEDVAEETAGTLTGFYARDRLDLVGSISMRDSDDIELGSGDTLPSDDDILSGLAKAEYQLTDEWRLTGSWLHFENEAEEPNNGQGVGSDNDALDALVEKDIESDTLRAGVEYTSLSNEWLNASLTLYTTETEVEEDEFDTTRSTVRNIETDGVSLRNASRFSFAGIDSTLTVGGDWYRDEQEGSDSETDDGNRSGVPDGESEFVGVFVQLEASIEEPLGLPGELLLIPGVRYDEYESESDNVDADDVDDDEVSPRIGISYGPVEWFRGFVNYAEAFRAPSINELYLDGTHFSLPHPIIGPAVFITNEFIPNPELTAEDSETIEVGFAIDATDVLLDSDRLTMKASYYESDVDDLIDLQVDFGFDATCFPPTIFPCSAGTSFSENVAEAELDGIEVEAAWETRRFLTRLTYSQIDGEDKSDGSDLGILTPDRIHLDLRWKLPEYNAAIGTRMQLADDFEIKQFDSGAGGNVTVEERDDYAVFDIYASWSPGFFKNVRIDASVENVADENYERVFEGVSEPGRNYKIAVTWQGRF